MVKKIFFILVMSLLLVQVVNAIDTEIKIKTLPNHEVQATSFDPTSSSFNAFERLINNSDEYGDISFVLSSDELNFNLIIFIKKDGVTIISKKYADNFVAGEHIYIELAPEWFEFLITPINETLLKNETIENTTIENTAIEDKNPSKLTGFAAFGEEGSLFKKIYYIAGIFLLLGALAFIGLKLMEKKIKASKEIKVKKLSELQAEKKGDAQEKKEDIQEKKEHIENQEKKVKEKMQNKEEIIEDAEKKIREAQEDIRKIRNEDKIKEAKKKLVEDQKKLMRLREGKE